LPLNMQVTETLRLCRLANTYKCVHANLLTDGRPLTYALSVFSDSCWLASIYTYKQTYKQNIQKKKMPTQIDTCMYGEQACFSPACIALCALLVLAFLSPPPPLSRYRYQNNYLMSSLARRPVIRRWVHSRRSLAGRSVVRRWSPSIGRRWSRSTRPTIARRRPRAASTSIPGRRSLAWASSPASWALLGVC